MPIVGICPRFVGLYLGEFESLLGDCTKFGSMTSILSHLGLLDVIKTDEKYYYMEGEIDLPDMQLDPYVKNTIVGQSVVLRFLQHANIFAGVIESLAEWIQII